MILLVEGSERDSEASIWLDESSAGLSPVLVDRVLVVVQRLRDSGTAVLLVEQVIQKWRHQSLDLMRRFWPARFAPQRLAELAVPALAGPDK